MGLFHKVSQRIVISSEAHDALKAFVFELGAQELKNIKISPLKHTDGQWQCSIRCSLAESLYAQELLPLLYDTAEAQSFEVSLAFDDEAALVAYCPMELMVSFGFDSRNVFGNKSENDFLHELHRDISHNVSDMSAAAAYYIVSGGAVTMCIPCADPEALKEDIRKKFNAFKTKKYMINVIVREPV